MNKKYAFLSMYVLIFIWFAYKYSPSIIFYFDQVEGIATIRGTNKHKVTFEYNHKELDRKIKLTTDIRDIRKVKKLQKGEKRKILYSKKFHGLATIEDLEGKPNLAGLFLLMLCSIPILFFKKIGFDELDRRGMIK